MGNMGNGVHEYLSTWVKGHMGIIMHRSRWWTEVMGHMGNGAHG